MILAAVDIGTLTCRLLIAKISDENELTEICSDRRISRLGEGVDQHRLLQPAAMQRVIDVLREWRRTIDHYAVDRETAVATSAVRDAGNRNEFLAAVKRETGFDVEVIAGEEEARRTLLGIRSGLPKGILNILALDIGGGSTEFILDRPSCVPVVRSFDIGVVRLTERVLRHDPPTPEEVDAERRLVRAHALDFQAHLRDLNSVTFTGTAGTITTLAAMAQRLPTYDSTRVHNFPLSLAIIKELERTLLAKTRDERRGAPGLEAGREGVIVAGAIILSTVMETLRLTACLVSDRGLREGMLFDLAARLRQPSCRTVKPAVVSGTGSDCVDSSDLS